MSRHNNNNNNNNNNWSADQSPTPTGFNAVFYIAARIHGVFRPLAVVAQIPTSIHAGMTMSKLWTAHKMQRIHSMFPRVLHPSDRCALRAELAAAVAMYSDGNGPAPVSLLDVQAQVIDCERPQDLQSTLFPFTTTALLRCIAGNQWYNMRSLVATNYWSPIHVGAVPDKVNSESVAVVFDVTDPGALACGFLSWECQQWADQPEYDVRRWCPIITGIAHCPPLSDNILRMLWGHSNQPVQRPLPEHAVPRGHASLVAEVIKGGLAGLPHVELVSMAHISCSVLATALQSLRLRSIETLSFTADVLNYSDDYVRFALLEVLYNMPSLKSVYVAEMRGPPTPENQARARNAQILFLRQARSRFGPDWSNKTISLSSAYLAKLDGKFHEFESQV